MKRLAIIVPYRARESHLARFVPHVRAYFARDKVDRDIPYRVLIVEQEAGQLFNRGMLKNIGFTLLRDESDYTCFHDIDYLPIWADYSWSAEPVGLVWYGAEERPVIPGRNDVVVRHSPETFFGGAVLVPNDAFAAVDGYANAFWGWGYEDVDLQRRFQRTGMAMTRRKGTFHALDHVHEGYRRDGTASDQARRNEALLAECWMDGATVVRDGLSTLNFDVISRRALPPPPAGDDRAGLWEMIRVKLPKP